MNNMLKISLFTLFIAMQTSYAHIYLEGYVGGMFSREKISSLTTFNTYGIQNLNAMFEVDPTHGSSTALGGFKVGWWPNHHESACSNSLREHFGLYLDTRYNELKYNHAICSTKVCYGNNDQQASGRTDISLFSKGPGVLVAGMLAVRCGFFATDKIPFGRLQPYLAVGPAGLFTRQCVQLVVSPHEVDGDHLTVLLTNPNTIASSRKHWDCAPGCALDLGARYLPCNHMFLDFFFNYRFSRVRIESACVPLFCMKQRYNLFSLGLGLGYEF